MDLFAEYNLEPFYNPLDNVFFMQYYLLYINPYYDLNKIYNDQEYLNKAYCEYHEYLIEGCRPNFPPNIDVEAYVEFEKKKTKDIFNMNKGNGFILYRRYIMKSLDSIGI